MTGARRRVCAAAAAFALGLAGCADGVDGGRGGSGGAFPPDRTAWSALPPAAWAAHARALDRALRSYETVPAAWAEGAAGGTVLAEAPVELDGAICRVFRDRLEGEVAAEVSDLACWRGHWYYVRAGLRPQFVLSPAYGDADGLHLVERGASLADLAGRLGVDAGALAELNPGMPDPVPAGAVLLLP